MPEKPTLLDLHCTLILAVLSADGEVTEGELRTAALLLDHHFDSGSKTADPAFNKLVSMGQALERYLPDARQKMAEHAAGEVGRKLPVDGRETLYFALEVIARNDGYGDSEAGVLAFIREEWSIRDDFFDETLVTKSEEWKTDWIPHDRTKSLRPQSGGCAVFLTALAGFGWLLIY